MSISHKLQFVFSTLFMALIFQNLNAAPSKQATPLSQKASELFKVQIFSKNEARIFRAFRICEPKNDCKKTKKTPLLVMLDGNAQLNIALNAYTKMLLNSEIPNTNFEIIAFDEPNGAIYDRLWRTKNYTPKIKQAQITQNDFYKLGGGAQEFLEFMNKELYGLDKNYTMGIFGHSFGGVFVLYALQNYANFSRFYAASPSLWWDDGAFGKQAQIFAQKFSKVCKKQGVQILITKGENESGLKDGIKISESSDFVNAQFLANSFRSCAKFIEIKNANHGDTIAPSIELAIKNMLDF